MMGTHCSWIAVGVSKPIARRFSSTVAPPSPRSRRSANELSGAGTLCAAAPVTLILCAARNSAAVLAGSLSTLRRFEGEGPTSLKNPPASGAVSAAGGRAGGAANAQLHRLRPAGGGVGPGQPGGGWGGGGHG